jgi:hypothetical protein
MTTSDPEDQNERRRVLRNDARVRDQSRNGNTGTFLSHTHIDDAGGRFAAVNAATIVGSEPAVKYPQLPSSSPWHGSDPVPDEPPLGYRVDALNPIKSPTGVPSVSPLVATDDPAHAPSSDGGPATPSGGLVSERAGSSPFSESETEKDAGNAAA